MQVGYLTLRYTNVTTAGGFQVAHSRRGHCAAHISDRSVIGKVCYPHDLPTELVLMKQNQS
jgi:hypothetical protein